MPSNHLILCPPLLLLPPLFPSIRVFSNESALHIRWPKYWSFSFSIHPSNEHPGLISFRTDWLDLLAVQGTLKSLLQHHSSKASVLQCSVLFMVQLSHPSMTTGKTTALTIQPDVNEHKTKKGSSYMILFPQGRLQHWEKLFSTEAAPVEEVARDERGIGQWFVLGHRRDAPRRPWVSSPSLGKNRDETIGPLLSGTFESLGLLKIK